VLFRSLMLSQDGRRLYVNNFMDRTVGVFDLGPLLLDRGSIGIGLSIGTIDGVDLAKELSAIWSLGMAGSCRGAECCCEKETGAEVETGAAYSTREAI